MVFKTAVWLAKRKKPLRNYLKAGFRDSLKIYVSGGYGGNGLPKFGGIGGQGGNVFVVAKEKISLEEVYRENKTRKYVAENGMNSSHNFIRGKPGADIKIDVPVGVSLYTELGKKLGLLMKERWVVSPGLDVIPDKSGQGSDNGELDDENTELLIAKGGTGGHSKNGFLGTQGQEYPVRLDLKLIADIGLVGFPNAGKSTLLGAISHAKPKVANYPFTTMRPHLGMILYKDKRQIAMADLPGLIEGAHMNRGMGHKFLKHVERTKLLLLIVDINGFQLSPQYPHRTCLDTIILLNKELELYKPYLIEKPSLILINKMDSDGAQEKYEEIKENLRDLSTSENYDEDMRPENFLKFREILPISVKENKQDVEDLKEKLRKHLDILAEEERTQEDDLNLYENIREKMRERGPKLI